jgi:hypothetical protein
VLCADVSRSWDAITPRHVLVSTDAECCLKDINSPIISTAMPCDPCEYTSLILQRSQDERENTVKKSNVAAPTLRCDNSDHMCNIAKPSLTEALRMMVTLQLKRDGLISIMLPCSITVAIDDALDGLHPIAGQRFWQCTLQSWNQSRWVLRLLETVHAWVAMDEVNGSLHVIDTQYEDGLSATTFNDMDRAIKHISVVDAASHHRWHEERTNLNEYTNCHWIAEATHIPMCQALAVLVSVHPANNVSMQAQSLMLHTSASDSEYVPQTLLTSQSSIANDSRSSSAKHLLVAGRIFNAILRHCSNFCRAQSHSLTPLTKVCNDLHQLSDLGTINMMRCLLILSASELEILIATVSRIADEEIFLPHHLLVWQRLTAIQQSRVIGVVAGTFMNYRSVWMVSGVGDNDLMRTLLGEVITMYSISSVQNSTYRQLLHNAARTVLHSLPSFAQRLWSISCAALGRMEEICEAGFIHANDATSHDATGRIHSEHCTESIRTLPHGNSDQWDIAQGSDQDGDVQMMVGAVRHRSLPMASDLWNHGLIMFKAIDSGVSPGRVRHVLTQSVRDWTTLPSTLAYVKRQTISSPGIMNRTSLGWPLDPAFTTNVMLSIFSNLIDNVLLAANNAVAIVKTFDLDVLRSQHLENTMHYFLLHNVHPVSVCQTAQRMPPQYFEHYIRNVTKQDTTPPLAIPSPQCASDAMSDNILVAKCLPSSNRQHGATHTNAIEHAKLVDESQCSICLSAICADDDFQALPPCGHTVHDSCVTEWFQVWHHNTCPLCRQVVLYTAPSS